MLNLLRNSESTKKGTLESKSGILNLRGKHSDQQGEKNILIKKATTRFKSFLDCQRISSRPISVIRATDSDILHLNEENFDTEKREKDELLSIPILPADEMDTLTSEIKIWKRNRRYFWISFYIIQLCAFVTAAIAIAFTGLWYHEDNIEFGHRGSQAYNWHMILHVINVWLLTIGLMMFRVAPNAKTKNIIIIHSLLGVIAVIIFAVSLYIAIIYHTLFTTHETQFYSLHSWIGLIAAFLYGVAFLTGIIFMSCPTKSLKRWHSVSGTGTISLCAAGILTGSFYRAHSQLGKSYILGELPAILMNLFGVFLVLQIVLIRLTHFDFVFRRRPKPQWDVLVHRNLEAIEEAFFDVHNMYENFENWIKQINATRLRALRVPRKSVVTSEY